MSKKTTYKNFILTLVFLILLFIFSNDIGKSIRRFTKTPIINENIYDSNSRLLTLLPAQNSFPNDWKWDLITTHQMNNKLNLDEEINDRAIRRFVGVYGNYMVQVVHSITSYENELAGSSSTEPENEMDNIGVSRVIKTYRLEADFMQGKLPTCYLGSNRENQYVTRCILVLENGNMHERFYLDTYTDDYDVVLKTYNEFLKILK